MPVLEAMCAWCDDQAVAIADHMPLCAKHLHEQLDADRQEMEDKDGEPWGV